jgi:hypothetical protein
MTANMNEEKKVTGLPAQGVVDRTEEDLINTLLAAADYKDDESVQKKVEIRRNGKVLFSFHVRPLGEPELQRIRKLSTPMFPNPEGKRLPKIEGDIRYGEFKSRKIYEATVEADREKMWDNPSLKRGLAAKGIDIMENWEIIDAVLMAGEKNVLNDAIDDLSGYDMDLTEYAKN